MSSEARAADADTGAPNAAIQVERLGKQYHVYKRPQDRLKQGLWRGRRRYFEEFWALRELSIELERGETFGVIGRNGSGKSTFLHLVAGTLSPTTGEIAVRGRVAALLELGAGFHPDFTGRENVFVYGALMGLTRAEIRDRLDAILAFAEIGDAIDRPIHTYSSGMYVRLAFAVAVSVDADVLVIDEALAVGDESFQRKCFARLAAIRERGGTILFVSHSSEAVLEICDRALLLDRGERVLLGAPRDVVNGYHRMLYAPADGRESVRQTLIALDRAGADATHAMSGLDNALATSAAAATARSASGNALERPPTGTLDPTLSPKSTTRYVGRGAAIGQVLLQDETGQPVNVLKRGAAIDYVYRVHFSEACRRVRFGMLLKTVTGVELGGLASHPEGQGLDVPAGAEFEVRFPIRARLAPGVYFFNAGVVGLIDGEERYLDRILDALALRVESEVGLTVTRIVDFANDGASCVYKVL